MQSPAFSTAQVAELTGLSIRQLNCWSQTGMFLPSVQQAHGSGTRKLYSLEDVVQLRSLAQLKCQRWSTQRLRNALTLLRKVIEDPNPLGQAVLIADKTFLVGICKTRQGEQILLDALSAGGQQVMGIVIETLQEDTQREVARFLNTNE